MPTGDSGVPRHQALAERLIAQIADGTYAVGDRLPTEVQLCATHDLARGTVRRALGRLDQLGMIDRRPSAGTIVTSTGPVSAYQPVAQSAADITALAAETRLIHRRSAEVVLDGAAAERVGVAEGTTWFLVQGARVRRSKAQVPMCWSEHYLRGDIAHERLTRRFTTEDVASHTVEQVISAGLIRADIAEQLQTEAGSAALVITRRHLDADFGVVSVGIHTHPADRYSIATVLPGADRKEVDS